MNHPVRIGRAWPQAGKAGYCQIPSAIASRLPKSGDLIITVCDNAAGEPCPVWPGRPISAHWGIEDPAAVEGEGQKAAFLTALRYLHNRISLLLNLSDDAIGELELREIGRSEGATAEA